MSNSHSPETPVQPAGPNYTESGVDLTLIRWHISLTPAQRLEALTNNIRAILRLRDARKRA
ncbi:MAG: hypothetical protein DRQ59_02680 [Gammaproteobacteria bacterium]|nr:MAG: hypothetical protein DRQ59_02680 [Gammaproteobacteria bacterium]